MLVKPESMEGADPALTLTPAIMSSPFCDGVMPDPAEAVELVPLPPVSTSNGVAVEPLNAATAIEQ
jgi:hypothetical protein